MHGTHVTPAPMRTQVWLEAEPSLVELANRTNSHLAAIEGAGGQVQHIEVIPTVVVGEVVLYTVVVIFREVVGREDED